MNNAKITIKSKEENDISEITYFGRAWEKESFQYFEYTEVEQSQNKEFKVTYIFNDSSFTMTRGGEMQMTMVYDESKLSKFSIKTDVGELDVVLRTLHLKIDNFERESEIDIVYELTFSNGETYMHSVNINLRQLI